MSVLAVVGVMLGLVIGIPAVGVVYLLIKDYATYKRITSFRYNGKHVPHCNWLPPLHELKAQMQDLVGYTKRIDDEIVHGKSGAPRTPCDVYSMVVGPLAFLAPLSESLVKQCLTTSQSKFSRDLSSFGLSAKLLHGSILANHGERWRRSHRVFSEFFTVDAVKGYRPIFVRHAQTLIDEIKAEMRATNSKVATIDVVQKLKELTNKVICDALFGDDLPLEQRLVVLNGINEIVGMLQHPLAHMSFVQHLTFLPFVQRQKKVFEEFNTEIDRIVAARASAMAEGNCKPNCIIDHIIQFNDEAPEKEKFTPDEIRGNVRTFFAAGTDTTANGMAWTLYHLARDESEYKKVEQELLNIPKFQNGSNDSDMDDYPVPFAESRLFAALNESLRTTPPAVVIGQRDVVNEMTIGKEGDEVFFPEGSRFIVHIYLYHHLRKLWPDPFKFMPDRMFGRFVSPQAAARDFKFIPFGNGQRSCIGRFLAYDEMMCVLARVLQEFDVLPARKEVQLSLQWPAIVPLGLKLSFAQRELE